MKKNKTLKRFLAFLLCAAMMVTYMPSSVYTFADDSGEATSAVEPVEAAPAPETKAEPVQAQEETKSDAPETPVVENNDPAPEVQEEESPVVPEEEIVVDESNASENDTRAGPDAEEEKAEDADVEKEKDKEEAKLNEEKLTFTGKANSVNVKVVAAPGTFPEGTTMKVTSVAKSEVKEAVESALDDVKNFRAVDITFYADGKEVQPKKNVAVKLSTSALDASEALNVVHVEDSGAAEVMNLTNASTTTAQFKTDGFSVYIVVDTDVPGDDEQNAVATYNFYVGDEIKYTQYLKTGETLVDPGDQGDGANKVFKGWYIGDEEVDFSKPVSVPKETTVRVDAKIENTYYVTFLGEPDSQGDRPIAAVKTITVEEGESGSIDPSSVIVIPKDATSLFKGWSTEDGGEPVTGNVTVSGHMNLYAVIVTAYWIRFDENDGGTGGGASYTGPVAVEEGKQASTVKPKDPTRKGYDFGGWYTDADCTQAFNWNQTLSDNVVLYAKWDEKANTEYKVIVWKQKVTDAKGAADSAKTYDYVEYHKANAATNADIVESMYRDYTRYNYTGFHYSRVEYDEKTVDNGNKIRAKGDTVINVYYDRNLNTINFYSGWDLEDTMTGLYGQTLAQNKYEWPTDYDWYDARTGGTHVTFLDSFKEANQTYNLYARGSSSGYYYIRHYKQNIDDSGYPSTPTNQTRSNGGTWHFTEKYDGFTVSEYRVGDRGGFTSTSAGQQVRFDDNLYIHYTRNKYSLSFQDGDDMVDSLKVTGIPYEKKLTSYEPTTAPYVKGQVRNHMVFQGWFEDPSLTKEFDWGSTMPAADKIVYAKWTPERYKITLDPDGGNLPEGQKDEFMVDYLEVVSQSSLEKTTKLTDEGYEYELIGWFDKDTGEAYGYPKVEKNTNLIAKWRFPGLVSIVYDPGAHGSGEPSDEHKYATDASVVVGAPPTDVEDGWEFVGWELADTGKSYYPNNKFDITDELLEGNYDPETKIGTITLKAKYKKKGSGPEGTTHIYWYKNDGSEEPLRKDTFDDGDESTLNINEPVSILEAPEREGCVFLGWAKVTESDDMSYEQDLGEDDLFIYYNDGKFYSDSAFTKEVEEVAGDENTPYDALFAVWVKEVKVRVTADIQRVTYNGSEQSYNYTKTGAYKVEYKVGDADWTTTKPDGINVTEVKPDVKGTNVDTYTGTVSATISSTKASLIVKDEDKTATDTATLIIEPAEIAITVTGNTATKKYTGSEQSVTGYTATSTSDLYDASKVSFSGTAEAKGTEVGEYPMGLTEDAFSYSDTNVTATFTVTDGKLNITPADELVITVTGNSDSKVYNGEEQSVTGYKFSEFDSSVTITKEPGQTDAKATAKGTNVGTYKMTMAAGDFAATSPNYSKITFNVTPGELEITPADELEITVTGNSDSKVYNGEEQSVSGYEYGEYEDSVTITKELAQTDAKATAKGTNAGTYKMTMSAEDFAATSPNYKKVTFKVTPGELEITPVTDEYEITVTGNSDSKVYNGEEQSVSGYEYGEYDSTVTITKEPGQTGDKATAKGTNAGTYAMEMAAEDFAATSPNYTNITFKVVPGKLTITPADELEITVTGNSDSKVYNGEEQSVSGYEYGEYEDSVTITKELEQTDAKATAKGTNAGTYKMTMSAGDFAATSPNYKKVTFKVTPGELEITPAEECKITVTGNSDSKVYNGEEQKVTGYEYGEYDSTVTITKEPGQTGDKATAKGTNVGTYKMAMTEEDFAGSSPNYKKVTFTVTPGELEITPITDEITVTITGHKDTKDYNGKEQKVTGYDFEASNPLFTEDFVDFTGTDEAKGRDAGEYPMGLADDQFANNSDNFTNVTFVVEDGSLTVNKLKLKLTSASAKKKYDGSPLTKKVVRLDGKLAPTDKISFNVTGSQTYVGKSDNTFTYKIEKDPTVSDTVKSFFVVYAAEEDETEAAGPEKNYDVEVVLGELEVTDDVDDDKVITKTHEDKKYKVGDTITFTIKVKNIYDEEKTITIEEQEGVTITGDTVFEDVAPGETVTTTATHKVTEADAKAGKFKNVAKAKFDGGKTFKGKDTVDDFEKPAKKGHGPDTGDNTGLMGLIGVFGASVAGFFAMLFRRRRENQE